MEYSSLLGEGNGDRCMEFSRNNKSCLLLNNSKQNFSLKIVCTVKPRLSVYNKTKRVTDNQIKWINQKNNFFIYNY